MSTTPQQTFLLRPKLNEVKNVLELYTEFAEMQESGEFALLRSLKSESVIKLPLNQKAAKVWHPYLHLLFAYGFLPYEYYEKMVPEEARRKLQEED